MDIPEDEFRMLPDINYLGTGNGTRVALRRILPHKPDAIGPVASTISNRAVSPQRPGSSSEHATRGFTAAARTELVYQGSPVRLTMVRPPWSARRSTPTRVAHAGARPSAAKRWLWTVKVGSRWRPLPLVTSSCPS